MRTEQSMMASDWIILYRKYVQMRICLLNGECIHGGEPERETKHTPFVLEVGKRKIIFGAILKEVDLWIKRNNVVTLEIRHHLHSQNLGQIVYLLPASIWFKKNIWVFFCSS